METITVTNRCQAQEFAHDRFDTSGTNQVLLALLSVQPPCSLGLRGGFSCALTNHGDTEGTEVAQRKVATGTDLSFRCLHVTVSSSHSHTRLVHPDSNLAPLPALQRCLRIVAKTVLMTKLLSDFGKSLT